MLQTGFIYQLKKYFPDLSSGQLNLLENMTGLYRFWNKRINVISRRDIDNIEIHHIIHSLAIAKFFRFIPGTKILDAGTGGGFPGMPLAVLFPDAEFTLVDSIAKKIKVVETIITELRLTNIIPVNARFEAISGQFDFITGRAVSTLPEIWESLKGKILEQNINDQPNGMLYLKGGEFSGEVNQIKAKVRIYQLSEYFHEPYFETKKLIHIIK